MKPSISLRPGVLGDEHALALIGQSTFLESYADVLKGSDIVVHCANQHAAEKYRSWLTDGSSRVWLAELEPGRAPIGYVLMTKPDLPDLATGPNEWELKRIYVLHRFQGGGLGKRLMNAAIQSAADLKATRLLVGVYGKNAAAIAFYQRLGYSQVGTRRFQVGTTLHDDLILALPIRQK